MQIALELSQKETVCREFENTLVEGFVKTIYKILYLSHFNKVSFNFKNTLLKPNYF